MANFTELKAYIRSYIYENHLNDITGEELQGVLIEMVEKMGDEAINEIAQDIADEITARQNAVSAEAEARALADTQLDQKIYAEEQARIGAMRGLEQAIQTEQSARAAADQTLDGKITAEETARIGAVRGLEQSIQTEQSVRSTEILSLNTFLNSGYLFIGVAATNTNPGTPDRNIFYLTADKGTFTNFLDGSSHALSFDTAGLRVLYYVSNSGWQYSNIILIDDKPNANSSSLVKSGGVDAAIRSMVGYLVCTTEGATAAKIITGSFYILQQGGSLKVKFTNKNTADDATLKIGDAEAQPLYYAGRRAGSSNSWEAGEVVEIFYDGTKYYANNVMGGGAGDGAFDISIYNSVEGTPTKYADLTAALGINGANIPDVLRKGGMSVKFVHSVDNKYIQARCMAQNFTTDVTQWQSVDETPIVGSQNLVTSGGVEKVIGSDFVIEKDIVGQTKYPIRVGHTYTITNLLSSGITVSTRETEGGENHDTTTVPGNSAVVFTPTVDGEWIRTGASCKIQIIDNGSLLARVRKNETNINTIDAIVKPLKFHSSVAKYCVKEEGFKTGLYWYEDNTTHKVVSMINQSMSGVASGLDVVAGDKVMFNLSGTTQVIIILADSSDNVIANYVYASAAPLNGKLVIPAGCTKLYFNTLQSAVSDSFVIVNGEYMDDFQGQIDDLMEDLWVIQPTEIQIGKGVQSSTGNIVDVTSQNAVVIDLTKVKAKRIKFVLTISSTYGYGFIVNGIWSGKRYSSFPSGLYYQQLDIEVPEGATEFRFSWSSTLYTEDNPIYCILEDALMQVYEGIGDLNSDVASLENAIFKERVLDISDIISDGGILLDGTFDTNTTFGRIEIPLNEDVVYKSFTFKKTYVKNTTRCCYGFVVNNQWVGYPGMNTAQETPIEVTIAVPEGATIFRVSWNRNIIADDNYVLKALATANNAVADANNKPVFQFEPDFVLSRVPQLECPSKATVLALKPAQVYDMYDGLMTSYPNYITKVDCDAVAQAALEITAPSYMEGLPIYMYKFTPKIGGNGTGADQTSRFKILITSMHPQEKFGILAMFDMAKMICENWANDVNAEQLRSLVDIYIMPCPWPWNMENGSRVNYNGVNGNRQFPTSKWVQSGQGTSDWSGTEPLSEYEAKVINYFLLQIQPHVSVDVHTSGNDNVGHMGIFLVNQFDQPLVDLCGVIARTTSNRAIQDNSNFPQDGDTCMYGVYPEDARAKGEFYEYAYEQGCKYSILSEESPYSNWTNGVFGGTSVSPTEEYTDGILREQVQYQFNTVLRLIKAACIQYYSD